MKRLSICVIRAYQVLFSPLAPRCCRTRHYVSRHREKRIDVCPNGVIIEVILRRLPSPTGDGIARDHRDIEPVYLTCYLQERLRNLLDVGELVSNVCLKRTESRGSHYRVDYPERNDEAWQRCITAKKTDGGIKLDTFVIDPEWEFRPGDMGGTHWG